jgi:thioredoxin 1
MGKSSKTLICFIPFLLWTGISPAVAVWAGPSPEIPVRGMVTLVDLGANACLPCKMMAPILEKLEKVYRGKAAIVFIDVWKNREAVDRFKINAIPTQIFFNQEGQEVYRHMGFMNEKDIVAVLKKLGVQ